MKKKINNFDTFNSTQLFGLDKFFHDFVKLYESNKLPKVLLLSGEKGLGKFTLVFHLVNYLLSNKNTESYNLDNFKINQQSHIYKQILSNVCQNFVYISNENINKTSIENIRSLKKTFNNSLLNNMPRFIVFDDVELLNINSANSLLKLIEEPSDINYFVLIDNKRQKIIETIKSRAIETKFYVNIKEKKEILDKLLNVFNLENYFSYEYLKLTTPGQILKYTEYLMNLSIDLSMDFYEITSVILNNYKKNKDDLLIDTLIFILEIKFSKNINNKDNCITSSRVKIDLLKLLNNYKKFNLSNSSILEYVKSTNVHYA